MSAQDSEAVPLGRPFKPGRSGNPGGQPKWVKQVRAALREDAQLAADVLREVMQHGEQANRVRAAQVVLSFVLPKPESKLKMKLNVKTTNLRPELAARLAALEH